MSPATREKMAFGSGLGRSSRREIFLRRGADLVRVEPKVMDVLVYFAGARARWCRGRSWSVTFGAVPWWVTTP
jgi:hypothetical protein